MQIFQPVRISTSRATYLTKVLTIFVKPILKQQIDLVPWSKNGHVLIIFPSKLIMHRQIKEFQGTTENVNNGHC